MESREQEAVKVWDLGPDIAAEFLLLNGLDDEGLDRIPPLFDPEAFKLEHLAPTMEQFKLPDEELQYQGFVTTEIR